LAYYFVLALFPMLVFLISLFGYFAGEGSALRRELFDYIAAVAPEQAAGLIQGVIDQVVRASGGAKLSLGLLGALWAASSGVAAIVGALNTAYDVEETRPWWKVRLVAVWLTIALSLLIISALVLILYGVPIAGWLASSLGLGRAFTTGWAVLQWPFVLLFVLLAFSLIYYQAPDLKEERRWRWFTPGAGAGVALWLLASFGMRVYLHYFNTYDATYGSLGVVIVLLLWLYVTGMAVMLGGEINSVIEHAAGLRAPSRGAVSKGAI
jgi:membrane protein